MAVRALRTAVPERRTDRLLTGPTRKYQVTAIPTEYQTHKVPTSYTQRPHSELLSTDCLGVFVENKLEYWTRQCFFP